MKAAQITEFGGPEVMKYVDVADPTPGEGEAVVKIQAAGVTMENMPFSMFKNLIPYFE